MWKTVTTVACVVIGAGLLGWYERFHFIVGVPIVVAGSLGWWWLTKRWRDDEEQDLEDDTDEPVGVGHQLLMGGVRVGMLMLLLGGSFRLASVLGIEEVLSGPTCQPILDEIAILKKREAYEGIVQVVDEQLARALRASCREMLREHKARALLASAERLEGPERVVKLQEALQEAESIGHPDLQELASMRLQYAQLLASLKTAGKPPTEQPAQATGEQVIMLPDVLFQTGKADLTPEAVSVLRRVAEILNQAELQHRTIRIEGHTDSTGVREANSRLSRARADRVAQVLVEQGVSQTRLKVEGYGAERPTADNDTIAGRARNRRVEVIIEQVDRS